MNRTRRALSAMVAAGALVVLAACGGSDDGDKKESGGGAESGEVEVFTWWAEGSEKAGLDALVAVFNEQHPGIKFVNGAVAGGAGSDAKNVLASRLQTNDPPGTFQAHAGAEVTDYINNGQIEDLTQMYADNGWNDYFPQTLLDRLTMDGKIYSVPSNIHRANVVWANPAVLKDAGVDPNATYATLDDWLDPGPPVRDRHARRPGRRRLHRPVGRDDRLGRVRRDRRPGGLPDAARPHQRGPSVARLARRHPAGHRR
jgi:glucose/mannose transport system substrate-binding protein